MKVSYDTILRYDFYDRKAWDAATCSGTLNYKHDEPTSFFFFIPVSKLLTGDFLVDHLYLEEESLPPNWIMGSGRRAEEEEEGGR